MTRLLAVTTVVCFIAASACEPLVAQVAAPGRATAQQKEQAPVPVPVAGGEADLTPQNSTIQFVGTHIGDKPDPRTGYFTKFTGQLTIDEPNKALTGVAVDIETPSLVTPIQKLTNHLKSPDFFDVRQYPKATFESTGVEATDADAGKYKIIGDLTIRDVTKPITFPATMKLTDAGVVLTSKFKIKRSEFGMSFGPDRVVDDVAMTIIVGRPTPKIEAQ
jgi:polyisoprenoid-binding protein YceI